MYKRCDQTSVIKSEVGRKRTKYYEHSILKFVLEA